LVQKDNFSFEILISTLLILPITGMKSIREFTSNKDNELG